MAARVTDNQQRRRYEVHVDGELAGFVTYRRRDGEIELVHTEVDDAFSGQGLAGRLARHALAGARAAGLAVLPSCEFVAGYIRRHPDELDLVPEDRRAEFGL